MWGNAAVGKRRESSGSGLDGRMVGREGMYLRVVRETRKAIICDAGEACRLLLANQTIYTISSWRWAGRRVRTPKKDEDDDYDDIVQGSGKRWWMENEGWRC